MNPQKRVARKLLQYGQSLRGGSYTERKTADKLVGSNPTAFVLGVIFDQGIRYKMAWEAPYLLRQRLGHLDVRRLARTPVGKLRAAVRRTGDRRALHRFVGKLPRWIKSACKSIVRDYDGDASQIWEECFSAGEVIERLDDFAGIGPKKAHMATRILHEDGWWRFRRWREINVAVDVHVKRVWRRAGLVRDTSVENIMRKAMELHPKYPGRLDYPTWMIGTEWCHSRGPDCAGNESQDGKACPLETCCPKVGVSRHSRV